MIADTFEKPNIKAEFQQFFDEMNILKSEKKERVETAMDFKKKFNEFYEMILLDIINGRFWGHDEDYINEIIGFYTEVAGKVKKDFEYDRDVIAKATQSANQIFNTTKNIVAFNEPDSIEYTNAVKLGIEIDEDLIPEWVKDSLSPDNYRVVTASENESLWVHNYKRHIDKVESGQLTHTWETMKDERVRPKHKAVDGQTKPINEPFIVDGYKLMFPGDTLTSNPPGDLVILCRCIEV